MNLGIFSMAASLSSHLFWRNSLQSYQHISTSLHGFADLSALIPHLPLEYRKAIIRHAVWGWMRISFIPISTQSSTILTHSCITTTLLTSTLSTNKYERSLKDFGQLENMMKRIMMTGLRPLFNIFLKGSVIDCLMNSTQDKFGYLDHYDGKHVRETTLKSKY